MHMFLCIVIHCMHTQAYKLYVSMYETCMHINDLDAVLL